jgi:hypothetical protein
VIILILIICVLREAIEVLSFVFFIYRTMMRFTIFAIKVAS